MSPVACIFASCAFACSRTDDCRRYLMLSLMQHSSNTRSGVCVNRVLMNNQRPVDPSISPFSTVLLGLILLGTHRLEEKGLPACIFGDSGGAYGGHMEAFLQQCCTGSQGCCFISHYKRDDRALHRDLQTAPPADALCPIVSAAFQAPADAAACLHTFLRAFKVL